MTIKEIEARCGMTRANVRFYEAEGLLSPQRLENGYRDYSEEDLAVLLRIRLLRTLGLPLEDIRALQNGERALPDILQVRLDALQSEQEEIDHTRAVCRVMVEDGASYETLDAGRYLDALQAPPAASGSPASSSDVLPNTAWRRFFARLLDMELYGILWRVMLILVFRVNVRHMSVWLSLLSYLGTAAMILLFEPALLSWLGTTPGKWVLGFRVEDCQGGRLTYGDAFFRTLLLLWHGLGLNLPLLRLYRMFRSKRLLEADEPLPWEDCISRHALRDRKSWRAAVYVCLMLLFGLAGTLTLLWADLPPHRGELTTAELCDNYNRLADWNESDDYSSLRLSEDGQWVRKEPPPNVAVLDGWDLAGAERPALQFTLKDGQVTAVGFSITTELPTGSVSGISSEELLAATAPDLLTRYSLPYIEALLTLSFAGAQKDAGLLMQEARDTAKYIQSHGGEDFTLRVYGLTVSSVTTIGGGRRTVDFLITR